MGSLWLLLLVAWPTCHGLGNKCHTYKPLANPMALFDKLQEAQLKTKQLASPLVDSLPARDPSNSQVYSMGKDAVVIMPKKQNPTALPPSVSRPPLAQPYTGRAQGDMEILIPDVIQFLPTQQQTTQKPTQQTTQKATQKATQKPTQQATQQPTATVNPDVAAKLNSSSVTPGPIKVDPSDPTNCGTSVNMASLRGDKCFQKWAADPTGTCESYPGSDEDDTLLGSYTGTICRCGTKFTTSGYNCTEKCSAKNFIDCGGSDQLCYMDDNKKPACKCIKGYKLEQSKCTRQADYCETCEFNCHMSQKCINSNNYESGQGYSCSPCDESLGFRTTMNGGDSGWCTNINECTDGTHKCSVNAECADKDPSIHNGTKYTCQCKAGWVGVGTVCNPCTNANECLTPNVCGKNSNCTDTPGSYTCKCLTGYKPGGTTYSAQGHQDCIDINECTETQSPCMAFSQCNNTDGSYECPCNTGYVGDGKTRGCKLDDRICLTCDKKTSTCGVNSAQTAYECKCIANHTVIPGNKTSCQPVTYCDKNPRCAPAPKSICTDKPDGSGYTCECAPGYVDEGTDDKAGKGFVCYSEDPCQRGAPCVLVAHTVCTRTNAKKAGYQCDCQKGYVRQVAGQGNDSAPCFEENGPQANNCTQCRPNSEICLSVGNDDSGKLKQCSCAPGYKRPEGEGYGECMNINECQNAAANECDPIRAECFDESPTKENGNVKYRCKCLAGFTGDGTKNTCVDIVECTETPDICGTTGEKICENLVPGYKCNCNKGFIENTEDKSKCDNIDECALSLADCNANTRCVDTNGGYNCTCDIEKNFFVNGTNEHGVTCGIYNVCKEGLQGKGNDVAKACPDPNHICTQDGNSYTCRCPDGFVANGQTCVDIPECRDEQKNDCDGESTTCDERVPGYVCVCKPGFVEIPGNSKRCEDKNECEDKTLINICNPNSNCNNTRGSYRCSCNEGFEIAPGGSVNIPYCQPKNPCASSINPCYGGDCIYDPFKAPYYKCACNYGLMFHNGTTCIDSKYCDSSDFYKCPPYSKCKGKICECDPGYSWRAVQMPLNVDTFKQRGCNKIDWCQVYGFKECIQKGKKCNNTGPGTGDCFCDAGFRMDRDGCHNIEECNESQAKGISICPAKSDCIDTPGSYRCECSDGYYIIAAKSNETHPTCEDLNECDYKQDNCSSYKNTECNNLNGGFECICKPGFEPEQIGGSDEGRLSNRNCVWQDPCKNNPCEERAQCDSSSGCAVCKCPPGYYGTGTKEQPCLDDEECDWGKDNCTATTENCINLPGSFRCDCKPGFEKNSKGVCEDRNECKKTPTICEEKTNSYCNNTYGSYLCVCKDGFIFDPKTQKCVDYKECSQPEICGPVPGNKCNELEGSYECVCDPGYERPCKAKSKGECPCKNINECDNATPCDKNAICIDIPGSFICKCKENYQGDAAKQGGCKYISICERNNCTNPHTHCVSVNEEKIRCDCDDGYIMSNGVCQPNPCLKIKCEGGTCTPKEDRGQLVAFCQCSSGSEFYNNKTDKCVNSNVCKCPNEAVTCTNSTACSDPPMMKCTPAGAEPECQCFPYLKFNVKTRKCENCDECLGKCPPDAVRHILKNSLGYNYDRDCKCKLGYIWQKAHGDPLAPGKCIIDKDCSEQGYCANNPNTVCLNGLCVCDPDKGYGTDINGTCYKLDACITARQMNSGDRCEGEGTIADGRGDYCDCDCKPGYRKDCIDGQTVCKDIPECKQYPQPCYNRSGAPYCLEKSGSYECTCNGTSATQGYILNDNGECVPPDLCKSRPPCPGQSSCIPADGTCLCDDGFQDSGDVVGIKKDPVCKDVDECAKNKAVCPENSFCNNTIGSYECLCNKGYEKVSTTAYQAYGKYEAKLYDWKCGDIDECRQKDICGNDPNIECFNYPGDYNCTCRGNYYQLTSKTCMSDGKMNATLCNTCSEHSTCIYVVGSTEARNCTCIADYEGNGVGKDGCKPIQYCGRNPPVCVDKAECVNLNPGYKCICPEGYTGTGKNRGDGCSLINFCSLANPCPREANCSHIGGTPKPTPDGAVAKAWTTCSCREGYEFNRESFTCIDVNECELKKRMIDDNHTPCPKIANCTNTQGSFTCECRPGWLYDSGKNECEDINECTSGQADSCKPATGKCHNTEGSWVCNCLPGFMHKEDTDKICEYVNRCTTSANPCNKTTSDCYDDFAGGFRCECKTGYQQSPNEPLKCVDINECTFPNNCNTLTQTCENFDGGYKCECRTGYHKDDKGLCAPSIPCNQTCPDYSICVLNRDNSSSCKCIDHYKWIAENRTCSIDACKNTDCGEGGTCVIVQNRNDSLTNAQLPYRCECQKGYTLDPIRNLCKKGDIINCGKDEACGIGSCKVANNDNGYTCDCPSSGCFPQCKDIACDPLAECRTAKRDGKVVIAYCQCPEGYRGFGTASTGCFPIQDCDERLCSKYAACKLVDGKSTCVCDSHYVGNGTYCIDRDECEDKTHNCDDKANCMNIQGGFVCTCKKGFTGSGTKGNCKDINECDVTLGLSECNITSTSCNNTNGGYHCVCKDGYRNTTEKFTQCPDINECNEENICGLHDCTNLIPGYECVCKPGYRLTTNKRACEDINECETGTHDCHTLATCTNTEGGYTCVCKEGYTGNGKTCEIIDKCKNDKDNNCNKDTTTCRMYSNQPNYKCECKSGYQKPAGQSEWHTCEDINECLNETIYDQSTTACNNTPGSYELQCLPGYLNINPTPSPQDVTCVPRDECAEDPAWAENNALLESGKVTPADWKTWMIPPKKNDSGYAFCYNEAVKNNRKFGAVFLPNCMNLEPNVAMLNMLTNPTPVFSFPRGFTCVCPNGGLKTIPVGTFVNPQCDNAVCNCNKDFKCSQGQCICADPKDRIRVVHDVSQCNSLECDSDYLVPSKLIAKQDLILCIKNVFVAKTGYRLVRNNATQEVEDVVDIDECTENKGIDPCCSDKDSCVGDYCVQCQNLPGTYNCAYRKGDGSKFCDRDSVDSSQCRCNQLSCGYSQSWYYSCESECNVTLDRRLADAKYNKPLCSKVVEANTLKYVTFPSLKSLYEFICSRTNVNQNKLACLFDSSSADLSTSPLFNYWGACTNDVAAVSCEGGSKPSMSSQINSPQCPARFTPIPRRPAIGQPIGQDWSAIPTCMLKDSEDFYRKGDFFVFSNEESPNLYDSYVV